MDTQSFLFSVFCFLFYFLSGTKRINKPHFLSASFGKCVQPFFFNVKWWNTVGEPQVVEGTRLSWTSSPFGFKPKMLFAFGDSYADTGNTKIAATRSWHFPYGITFPGKPSGRFSDGFVSTDFVGNINLKYLSFSIPSLLILLWFYSYVKLF